MLKGSVKDVEEERNEVRIEGRMEWLMFASEEKEEKIFEEEKSCDENVNNISKASNIISIKSKVNNCVSQQQQQ